MNSRKLTLVPLAETYAVCRLAPGEPIPGWATTGSFFCIARTSEELSIVCAATSVPPDVRNESGWRCFRLLGPIAFSEVGILVALTRPLADAGIGVFAVSTFDTDYVMVKSGQEAAARVAWDAAGHVIAAGS